MYQEAKPLFLICETPLHAGSGSDLGIVDLPIQRERHTSFPKIESSSLKGALREAVEQKVNSKAFNNFDDADVKIHRVFGYDDGGIDNKEKDGDDKTAKNRLDEALNGKTDFAGAIGFTDARLLLFPVKSMKGVFAWITCPKVLKQFERDMKLTNEHFKIKSIPNVDKEDECLLLSADNKLSIKSKEKNVIVLEEYAFKVKEIKEIDVLDKKEQKKLNDWLADSVSKEAFFKEKMKADIVILSNDAFKDFVNLSTEVITRTKIDNEKGVVVDGALFTEEYLPAESVMYALVLAHREFRKVSDFTFTADEVLDFFNKHLNEVVQIGGSATLGKGLVRTGKSFF